jgi:hypothetical protein
VWQNQLIDGPLVRRLEAAALHGLDIGGGDLAEWEGDMRRHGQ